MGKQISHKLPAAHIENRRLSERGHLPTYRRIMTIPDDERSSRRLAMTDDTLQRAAMKLTIEGGQCQLPPIGFIISHSRAWLG